MKRGLEIEKKQSSSNSTNPSQDVKSREDAIAFYDEYKGKTHVYVVNAEIVRTWLPEYEDKMPYVSTTTLIKGFFPSFDENAVIQKLQMAGAPGYVNVDPQEIKDAWKKIRDIASFRGTRMHEYFECILKGDVLPKDLDIIPIEDDRHVDKNGLTCKKACHLLSEELKTNNPKYKNIKKYQVYKSEWRLFDEEHYICGTVDCVLINPDNCNEFIVIDWKRSKEIKISNKYKETGSHPATKTLANCNFNHYTLQLNIYKRLIEYKSNRKVVEMYIININSVSNKCEVLDVKPMPFTVNEMFQESYRQRCEKLSEIL